MNRIYLDNNATTKPLDSVVEAVSRSLREGWANPSSVHRAGQAVRQQMELARQSVASLIGAVPREIVFTGSGTEAASLAIRGSLAPDRGRDMLITNRLEHSAVRELGEALEGEGIDVRWTPVDHGGLIDLDAMEAMLNKHSGRVGVVSVMWANNETGVIQPIERIGEMCQRAGVRLHVDGTQWVGKMPTDVSTMPIDLLTFSAHKFHGPKGVGSLYQARGVRVKPLIVGGPQERGLRAGTENVPGIIGMGAAADEAIKWLASDGRVEAELLRDRLESGLLGRSRDARVNGNGLPRLWNTLNIAFPHLEAEAILLLMSERGVDASAGAACSSGSLDPSPVLLAMGVEPQFAHGSIRLSLSRFTTEPEIDQAIETIGGVVEKLAASTSAAIG